MSSIMRRVVVVLVLAALLAPAAHAKPAPARTAPDPRRGERLDGRAAPRDPRRTALAVPRAVLFVPRLGFQLLFAPILRVSAEAEERHWWSRLYWTFTAEDRRSGLRPEFSYASGFSPAIGLRWYDRRTLGPNTLIQARFRTGGTNILMGELTVVPVPAAGLRIRVERTDQALFAGTRGESDDDLAELGRDESRYGYDRALVELGTAPPMPGRLSLSLRAQLDVHDYYDGSEQGGDRPIREVWCSDCATGEVDETLVPGFDNGTRRAVAAATLALDTRARPRFGSGVILELDARLAEGVIGDPSRDLALIGDVRLPIDLDDRAVVLGARAGFIDALGDAPVPFHHLLTASGSEAVRGMPTGRLRGSSILVFTAEYRWLLSPHLDALVFGDLGGAFGPGFDGLDLDHFQPTIGAGLRLFTGKTWYWDRTMLAGLLVAYNPDEGFRVLFSIEE